MPKHIRVIGPSSHIESDMVSDGIKWLENQKFEVTVADQVYFKNNQSAGKIKDKINAFHEAFTDSNVDIIMTSCGGNGAIHLLDHIDFGLIKNNPKPLIGFSDLTILLNAIHTHTGIPTYHGPTLARLQKHLPDDQLKQFSSVLNNEHKIIEWSECTVTKTGNVKGRLIGGNLSAFQTLLGTPHLIQKEEPLILFFEDIGDEISRYDRTLAHIRQSGLMYKASAILFGDLHGNDTPSRLPFGKTIEDIIYDNTKDLDIPIVTHCPFGHREDLWTLPVGAEYEINIDQKKLKLSYL